MKFVRAYDQQPPNISLQRTPARGFIFSDSSGSVRGPSTLSSWLDGRPE